MLSFLRKRRDSGESVISGIEDQPRVKSRKPPNTAFRQQRLKSWQPILSPKSVLPLLLLTAVIFTPLGIALIFTTLNVQQLVVVYDSCANEASTTSFSEIPSHLVSNHFKANNKTNIPSWRLVEDSGKQTCQIKFEVPNNITSNVFLYYRLTNFFQNHREYVDSFDLKQLQGQAVKADDISSDCGPLKTIDGKPIYPCGLIANSLFNDTFSDPYSAGNSDLKYEMTTDGIAWKADQYRFKETEYEPHEIVPPPNWASTFPDGYTEENMPDLHDWEALQVWMRTAGLPNFMKLAKKNEDKVFVKGEYIIDVGLNYPVSMFGGTKAVVLSTSSVIGGRNLSLGIAYLVVASLAVLFGVVFLVKYVIKPRKLGDHSYLNFNQDRAEEFAEPVPPTRAVREIL